VGDHDQIALASDDEDHVRLDDVLASPRPPMTAESQKNAVREIVRQAQRSRIQPPEFEVSSETNGYDVLGEIIGAAHDSIMFEPVTSAAYPITQRLYEKFKAALPAPKVVRVDTETSYAAFMRGKRAPHIDKFAVKLTEYHEAKQANTAEDIGVSDEELHVLGGELELARDAAALGGKRIPLSLGPWAEGKVLSWLDDGDIFCSMKLPGPDGRTRIATTSTPADRHVSEVLDYARDAQVDDMEVMGVLPALSQVLGGGALVTQLAKAAPELLSQPEVKRGRPFIGKIAPKGDATVAAIMALLQLVDKGDVGPKIEAAALRKQPDGEALFVLAENGLAAAKASRLKGAV